MLASHELAEQLNEVSGWEYDQDGSYTLGYLLRKLPSSVGERPYRWLRLTRNSNLGMVEYKEPWSCKYGKVLESGATTPEDAACKLAIELHVLGLLKRQEPQE